MIRKAIQFAAHDFDYIKDVILTEVLEYLQEHKRISTGEKYITINQVCVYLSISRPTLHQWSKEGFLTKHYINGLPRYKSSEIDSKVLRLEYGGKCA
jgi:predicted DNA-binding transcriptional regulator AlpA